MSDKRQCKECLVEWPDAEGHFRVSNRTEKRPEGYYSNYCHKCLYARKKRQMEDKPNWREPIREAAMTRYKVHKAWIDEMKLASGCVDCGYNKHAGALDYDHIPGKPKGAQICQIVCLSKARILKEIENCEVVCANCHRIRTSERGQYSHAYRLGIPEGEFISSPAWQEDNKMTRASKGKAKYGYTSREAV